MLYVKLLTQTAKTPTAAHSGEDIGYDLYADENVNIAPGMMRPVRTGVAIEFKPKAGAVLKCKSGFALKLDMSIEGGVIDAGYRGEIIALVRNNNHDAFLRIVQGDKICQMLEYPFVTGLIQVVDELSGAAREERGFGSTGNQ